MSWGKGNFNRVFIKYGKNENCVLVNHRPKSFWGLKEGLDWFECCRFGALCLVILIAAISSWVYFICSNDHSKISNDVVDKKDIMYKHCVETVNTKNFQYCSYFINKFFSSFCEEEKYKLISTLDVNENDYIDSLKECDNMRNM